MKITEDFIIQFTGNSSTVSRGKKLVSDLVQLNVSDDNKLIFGSCKGSGKKNYECSVDFISEDKPIPRCTCPSRQIPCKHVVALLYAKEQNKQFEVADIPEDIISKRGKIEKKEQNKEVKKAEASKPSKMTKAKATTAIKKCKAQLDGIDFADKMLNNIVLSGLYSIDAQTEKNYDEQVKELGNYYIKGIQSAFIQLMLELKYSRAEQTFDKAVEHVNYIYALLQKSRTYLEDRISDYEAFPEMTNKSENMRLNSPIEEQMGYAWKLTELMQIGSYIQNADMIQLAFNCVENNASKQWEDQGIWICLNNGKIYFTYNYRPFRAKKYVREEDSFFQLLNTENLYIYPGDKNPRARWETMTQRDIVQNDLIKAQSFAEKDYSNVIKEVKNQIKSPLADKNPVFLLHVNKVMQTPNNKLVLLDENDNQIVLKLEMFGDLIMKVSKEQIIGHALAVKFDYDINDDMLYAVPLSLVNDNNVIRFFY